MNHRLSEQSIEGHFTVFLRLEDRDIYYHDPLFGPEKHTRRYPLMDLFKPNTPNPEIGGNILIAVSNSVNSRDNCQLCNNSLPQSTVCPACKEHISLRPNIVLGCTGLRCNNRLWDSIVCPYCDHAIKKI